MINQRCQNDHTQNKFSDAFMELQIGKLMCNSNITKSCGISAYEVFQFLLLLAFQGKNLFRFLNSKHKDQAVSKNTYFLLLIKATAIMKLPLKLIIVQMDTNSVKKVGCTNQMRLFS